MPRAFTAKSIETLKPDPKRRKEVPDPALSGLYLVVQPSGVKSWAVRYRHGGKTRKMTLGKWPILSLADARLAASEAFDAVEHGRDPGREKITAEKARALDADRDTVDALVTSYASRHLAKLKSGATVKRELERHAAEAWKGRDINTIQRRDVLDLLDSIVDSGREVTANRVRAYLSGFFNWCIERGVVEVSPVAGVKPPAKEVSRDRVLSDDEIRWLWQACGEVGQPWGPMTKLLLLTGQRRSEVSGMTDREVTGETWHLSPDRTKNGKPHDVHLTDSALGILEGMERIKGSSGYVFTTTGETPVSGFNKAQNRTAKHMELIASKDRGEAVEIQKWGFHDLRRTAATGMARLGIPVRVTEAVLNHTSGTGGGIVAVYQRHDYADEKRNALEAWAKFVASLVDGEQGNVVGIGEKR